MQSKEAQPERYLGSYLCVLIFQARLTANAQPSLLREHQGRMQPKSQVTHTLPSL